MKNMINYKNAISKKLIHHSYDHFKLPLCYFQDLLNTKIEQVERKYFKNIFRKLSNKNDNPKNYWSLLKAVLNGKNVPCVPPIYHNDKFVSDIKKKMIILGGDFNLIFDPNVEAYGGNPSLKKRKKEKKKCDLYN